MRGDAMMKRIFRFSVGFLMVTGLGVAPVSTPAQDKRLDVPYVPTRYPVVDEMLKMAAVDKNDILYDLGCGDGRIVVAAAVKRGARGVGIDIDPERIAEARKNAADAGVGDRVKFVEGDLFQADFHEATVMALYLLTSVNLKLRPKLLAELRPGSRVVSHNFKMDNWRPDESSEIEADGLNHEVFLWIIPANVGGTWTWKTSRPEAEWELKLEQAFQVLIGKLTMNGSEVPMNEISLRGDRIRITAGNPDVRSALSAVFEGRAFSNSISGRAKIVTDGLERESAWIAGRNPATVKPLDVESHRGLFDRD
jgi:precorrin-6B methylase 2